MKTHTGNQDGSGPDAVTDDVQAEATAAMAEAIKPVLDEMREAGVLARGPVAVSISIEVEEPEPVEIPPRAADGRASLAELGAILDALVEYWDITPEFRSPDAARTYSPGLLRVAAAYLLSGEIRSEEMLCAD